MIEAKGLNFDYADGTTALQDVNLKIKNNEIAYIIGPSGSGKTTLLKLFLGIEYPTKGTLEVLSQPIIKGQTVGIRNIRKMIGPVFQEFRLIDGRTAMENTMLGMRFLDFSPKQLKDNSNKALEVVGLADKKYSLVENLSFGERQRVAIARAVARKPALILADEPTGNLDKDNALNILKLLASFKSENTSVIITTHATHLINGEKGSVIIRMDKGYVSEERIG
ncbi:MAG: ATP-binding cassette domain-containing protein [Clostridiales bacterium]|jgi:cell division transport system ATP-binding protein|nr:ATP-binding cassette domain-containing protein [Clostridiales bacterium]